MISKLAGTWAPARFGASALVDASGVGWQVDLLDTPTPGDRVEVFVAAVYRDGEPRLYGFSDEASRAVFELLLTVPGVGAATSMEALRTLGAAGVCAAVTAGDDAKVATVRGIGAKGAKRIVSDLDVPAPLLAAVGAAGDAEPTASADDLVDTLVAMGWPAAAAAAAVAEARATLTDEAEIISAAMAALAGGGDT